MVKASFIIKMEDIIKDIGRATRWMDMGSCTIRVVNLLMRVIGLKMNLMESAKSTMIIQ